MNQIMFPMVDKTDFATVESGITASDFNSAATKKFFGVNHGVSDAFTSGTLSKAATLVRSGIFQQTAKAAETNYDYLIYKFTHPSCADQLLIFETYTDDDSDIMSRLSDFFSDFQSRVPKLVATNSQLSDLHSDLRSFLIVMSGVLSDVYSDLSDLHSDVTDLSGIVSDFYSDFQSRVPKRVATDSQLSDLHSDLRSFLIVMSGVQSDVHSGVQLLQSAFIGHTGSTASQVTDPSTVEIDGIDHDDQFNGYYFKVLGGSQVDELRLIVDTLKTASQIVVKPALNSRLASGIDYVILAGNPFQSDMHSDLRSRVSEVGSDLRSYLLGLSGTLSDTYSLLTVVDSRVLANQSQVSDIDSMLTVMSDILSDFYSDFQSRVPKRVATDSYLSDVHSDLQSRIAGITASVSTSDMSDIASRVWATALAEKLVTLNPSDMSDLRSAIAAGPAATVTASDISNIASAVWANVVGARVDSRVLLNLSRLSDVYSMLSDVYSDFQSRVPKRVATDSYLSDVHSDLASKIAGITASVSASDISDIASAVWANTIGARVDSRVLLNLSRISDVYSLASDLLSEFQSRVPKRVATDSYLSDIHSDLASKIAGLTVTVTASDMSDIASRVWATTEGARVDSRLLVVVSQVSDIDSMLTSMSGLQSDIYSLLSDVQSDFQSRVPKRVATDSQLSDLASDLRSYLTGLSSTQSDIYSLLSDLHSDVTITSGIISDIYSNLQAGVVVGASSISDIQSSIWARADTEVTTIPAAAANYADKLNWMFQTSRNKRRTNATKDIVYRDDGTTVTASAALSAITDSRFVRGEYG